MSDVIARTTVGAAHVRSIRLRKRLYDLAWGLYGLGTAALGSVMVVAGLFDLPTPLPAVVAFPVAALALGMYAWPALLLAGLVAGRKRSLGRATATTDASGAVEVVGERGSLRIEKSALAQGAVVGPRTLVLEDTAGREVTLETSDDDAAALLDRLDLDPSHRRFKFRWRSTSERVWSFIGATFAASFVASAPMLMFGRTGEAPLAALGCLFATSPWLLAELVSRWTAIRELTVGLDGVVAQSRRGRRTLRFADVDRVETTPTELVLVMRDGRREALLADPAEPGMRGAILARVAEARAIAKAHAGEGSVAAALLERAGRSLEDWRAAAARVLTAATGFRDATITPDEIGAVIDDASATAEQRLAAAIALGARDDASSRARIRVAADACASPKLRVALEGLADGAASDAALEAAMDEEAASRPARRDRAATSD